MAYMEHLRMHPPSFSLPPVPTILSTITWDFSSLSEHGFHCHLFMYPWLTVYSAWNGLRHSTSWDNSKNSFKAHLDYFLFCGSYLIALSFPYLCSWNTKYRVSWYIDLYIPLHNIYTVQRNTCLIAYLSPSPVSSHTHIGLRVFKSTDARILERLQCARWEKDNLIRRNREQ